MTQATFPGHYCPGLIEGSSARELRSVLLSPFRGITAPASLKGGSFPLAPAIGFRPFPGHYCPGLIEGGCSSCEHPRSTPPFRGITAPASLKGPQR